MSFNDPTKPYYGDQERQNRLNTNHRLGIIARTIINDADHTAKSGEQTIVFQNLTAPRTLTLSPANGYTEGQSFCVIDESGTAATNNIIIQPSGGETINGSVSLTIVNNYGTVKIYTDGTNWFIL